MTASPKKVIVYDVTHFKETGWKTQVTGISTIAAFAKILLPLRWE